MKKVALGIAMLLVIAMLMAMGYVVIPILSKLIEQVL